MSSEINRRSPEADPGNSSNRERSNHRQEETAAVRSASSDLIKSSDVAHRDDGAKEVVSSSNRENDPPDAVVVPDEIHNSSFTTVNARKMLIQYGKELVCLFAIALTTYATFQGPPKISRAPPPVPLFPKNSLVQEWPGGHLNVIQNKVSLSELSLVLFYAPWCAESQFAKNAYEAVANIFHREVYFSAVNCWQPGGECRLQYAKVQSWPVLMAYYPHGIAVQYNGPWLAQPLTKFIQGLMQPYKRISNKSELYRAQADSNSVVVGFFNSTQLQRREFQIFVQSAIKWLERDPYQDVQFAIVTGESRRNFDVATAPAIRLYNWNETLNIEANIKWTTGNITKWVKNNLNVVTTWIHPPGKKSMTLAPYLRNGPAVLFFTPKDYYTFNKDAYHMLKQIALDYYKYRNDSQNTGTSWNSMYSIRKENSDRYLKLKTKCANMMETRKQEEENHYAKCNNDEPNITFVNILNNSKYDKYTEATDTYCYIGPKQQASACNQIFSKDWRTGMKMKSKENISKLQLSMLRPDFDGRSATRLMEKTAKNFCRSFSLAASSFGNIYFKNEKDIDMAEFEAKVREFNRTLSFVLLDSMMYTPIAERLGVNIETMPKKSTIIIVDSENDSTYQMGGEISTEAIAYFVKNFISGSINRMLRATKKTAQPLTEKQVTIKEINSNEFRIHLQKSQRTVVVLFYSVQCALCSLMSQTLLLVAKILESMKIDFLRIDADVNDFQWQYTMATYPTVVIFPRNRTAESRVFPHSLKVNVPNMLGFVIANLSPEERLQAIFESCQFKRISRAVRSCSFTLRKEISDNISLNLRRWRHHPSLRSEIIRKLQILQRIYLFSFQIDTRKDLELIRKDIMQLKKN